MSDKLLTELQAFNAMNDFLEKYYEMTGSDDIGGLLGEMQFLHDEKNEETTADPAIWSDWKACVTKILKEPKNSKRYLKLYNK